MVWGRNEWNLIEFRMGPKCSDLDIDNFCVLYCTTRLQGSSFSSGYNLSV